MNTTGNGFQCINCGVWVMPGHPAHQCSWSQPQGVPAWPQYPTFQSIPPQPFTLEDIRRIVREELDRKPDSANVLQENNHE